MLMSSPSERLKGDQCCRTPRSRPKKTMAKSDDETPNRKGRGGGGVYCENKTTSRRQHQERNRRLQSKSLSSMPSCRDEHGQQPKRTDQPCSPVARGSNNNSPTRSAAAYAGAKFSESPPAKELPMPPLAWILGTMLSIPSLVEQPKPARRQLLAAAN